MTRKLVSRFVYWTTLATLAVAFTAAEQPVLGADGNAPVKKMLGRKGRLPAHYANVVNSEQREKINKIQEEYRPKIAALQEQLDALKKERDEKISAVLTAEQKKLIEDAAAAAKAAKAKQGAAQAAKPAEAAPVTPPADQKPAEPKSAK